MQVPIAERLGCRLLFTWPPGMFPFDGYDPSLKERKNAEGSIVPEGGVRPAALKILESFQTNLVMRLSVTRDFRVLP